MNEFKDLAISILGGAASAGLLKGPIQTINDLWYINFGHTASEKAAKIKLNQDLNVQEYGKETAKEISLIPDENIQEPKLNILGPALEASKYYIEDKEMRSMFAKLLASSMDNSKNNAVHNSFVEIIKQLSPLDAKNLELLNSNKMTAVAEIRSNISGNESYDIMISNLFPYNDDVKDLNMLSASLENIKRLGLITISYDKILTSSDNINPYSEIENLRIVESQNSTFNLVKQPDIKNIINDPSYDWLKFYQKYESSNLVKGVAVMTQFGLNFCNICID